MRLVCTLGGATSPAPMQFKFFDDQGYSGYLAFTPPTISSPGGSAHPLLLSPTLAPTRCTLWTWWVGTTRGTLHPPGPSQGPGA